MGVRGDPHAHVRRAAGFFAWSQTEPGPRLPDLDDVRRGPGAAGRRRARQGVDADAGLDVLRPRAAAARREARRAGRHGHDREAGRLRRPGQRHRGPADVGRRRVHPARPQVVHLGADERRVPRAGPGRRAGSPASWCRGCCPTATRNRLDVVRLKDKLGNRSNASSELEFDGTWAQRLGDEGRGVRTIIEMVAATRLDCVLGSASLMRQALAEASWHVAHRSAFGGLLADKPLMQNVRRRPRRRVRGRDRAGDPARRRGRPAATTRTRRRCAGSRCRWRSSGCASARPMMVAEALECLGGNGYVEESGLPLLLRESPLNSIWEGSGNVNALDVLRALGREPEVLDAWITEVGARPRRRRPPGPRHRRHPRAARRHRYARVRCPVFSITIFNIHI